MPTAKPRHSPPFGHGSRVPTLIVRHPHYSNYNTLVKLPALDEGDTVDYNVALIICGIISDNSWSTGWFARSKDGNNVCEKDLLLAADGDVFYFVGNQGCKLQSQQLFFHSYESLTRALHRQIPCVYFVGSLAAP